jgi:hypothetical protein
VQVEIGAAEADVGAAAVAAGVRDRGGWARVEARRTLVAAVGGRGERGADNALAVSDLQNAPAVSGTIFRSVGGLISSALAGYDACVVA